MAITTVGLTASLNWSQSAPNTGFDPRTQQGTLEFGLAGIDIQRWDQMFLESFVIPAPSTDGDSATIDLYEFVSLVCEAVLADRFLALQVVVAGAPVRLAPDASENPLVGFFGDETSSVVVPAGGCLVVSHPVDGDGWILSPTERNLLVTNLGEGDATVTFAAICSSTGSVTEVTAI